MYGGGGTTRFHIYHVTKHSHLGLNEFGEKKQITKFLVRASLHISLCKLISYYSLRYYVIKKCKKCMSAVSWHTGVHVGVHIMLGLGPVQSLT